MKEKAIASRQTIFDQTHYLELIEARGKTIRRLVGELKLAFTLSTALDVGCGVGFFARILQEEILRVHAFDGRIENVEEARSRFPGISFQQGDIQNPEICKLGEFDLVLCFGLLYHLENPLSAIRNLRALTRKVLLLESMCFPDQEPFLLLREEPSAEDQSLTDLSFYPSEGCLTKMCYRAGFKSVFRVSPLPDHEQFRDTRDLYRRRTILLVLAEPVSIPWFQHLEEPAETSSPWDKIPAHSKNPIHRIRRFFRKPPGERISAVSGLLRNQWKKIPKPIRLPFGALWIARNDHIGQPIREGKFENAEVSFVDRFLRPGRTVLDVGAHHGFYTLLASRRVGPEGRVFAFEPSPRERKSLLRHVRLNRCKNVSVEDVALGNEETQADLYVVEGSQTGCNSLRPPVVEGETRKVRVEVTSLDEFLSRRSLEVIDFVKLDVEGAELEVLKGASRLLHNPPRPIFMIEVYDIRTKPWGYRASEIVRFLDGIGYRWFRLLPDGKPEPISSTLEAYDSNLIAIPVERAGEESVWA